MLHQTTHAGLEWVPANERIPSDSETDKYGYVLVSFGGNDSTVARAGRFIDGQWVDTSGLLMRGVRS